MYDLLIEDTTKFTYREDLSLMGSSVYQIMLDLDSVDDGGLNRTPRFVSLQDWFPIVPRVYAQSPLIIIVEISE